MVCINTYSLIERVCVEATSYILSAGTTLLSYTLRYINLADLVIICYSPVGVAVDGEGSIIIAPALAP